MSCNSFCAYLDSQRVSYVWAPHKETFAAQEIAETLHVPGRMFAKAVLVHASGRVVMAVLPASLQLDLHKLAHALDVENVDLLTEGELAKICPDCEPGAFPPFGNLYRIDTWVDASLADSMEIVFNAGTHKDSVRIMYSDYVKLIKPRVARFAAQLSPPSSSAPLHTHTRNTRAMHAL